MVPAHRSSESQEAPVSSDRSGAGHVYALFTALYAPHVGGVERYVAGLAHELAQAGNKVVVVTSRLSADDPERAIQPDGVEVVRLPCRALMGGRLPLPVRGARLRGLLDAVAALHPDRVVLNNHFYELSHIGAAFADEVGADAIVIEHGSNYLTLGNPVLDTGLHAYEHAMARRLAAWGYPFAGVSKKAAEWARTFGIETAGVVPNALDGAVAGASEGEPCTVDFRAGLGLDDGDLLVASVGRLVPEKGVESLLEAARLVEQGFGGPLGRNVRCVFAFAGAGPLLDRVEAAGGCTVALGKLGAAEVGALLDASDVYCLPSRSEGFATTLLEACAHAAFPVVTDVGGVAELGIGRLGGAVLHDDSPTAIVGALQAVFQNRAECARQARALQESVSAHRAWHASAEALEGLFEGSMRKTAPSTESPKGSANPAGEPADASAADPKLEQLHRVLLVMLKDFATLCEREGLTWMANYGTALGALRHGGFIPWDDDVDICMPRADLERLEAIVGSGETGLPRPYFIVNARTHPGYPMATSRFVLAGTEFRDEALASMDFPSGIFLDLFPLDELADGERAFKRQVWRAWLYNKLAIAKTAENPYVGTGARATLLGAGARLARGVLRAPGLNCVDFNERSRAWLTRYAGERTRRVGFPCDTDRFWDLYETSELYPLRWVPFEDMLLPVPGKAEELLERVYGDWRTPPPEGERQAHYPEILDFGPYSEL